MSCLVVSKQNEPWVIYAINKYIKQIINFIVGRSAKRKLSVITKLVLQLYPKPIFTDKLRTYKKTLLVKRSVLQYSIMISAKPHKTC